MFLVRGAVTVHHFELLEETKRDGISAFVGLSRCYVLDRQNLDLVHDRNCHLLA
jgi:hypothetical protein